MGRRIDVDKLYDRDVILIDVKLKRLTINCKTTYPILCSYLFEIWRTGRDINGEEYIKFPIPHLYSNNTKDRGEWFLPDWDIEGIDNLTHNGL